MMPPDPSLALIFPTLEGDLIAACGTHSGESREQRILTCLEHVGLDASKLGQAARTLSGGESCLGSIAKGMLLAEHSQGIVACNPEQWLASKKRVLLEEMLGNYASRPAGWTLLNLDGEGDERYEPAASETRLGRGDAPERTSDGDSMQPTFSLYARNATVELVDATGLTKRPPFHLSFQTESTALRLESPAMWTAPNGVGKSVLARALTGSLPIVPGGAIGVRCAGFDGRARLIMQNCSRQLFGKRPREYIKWCFREATNHALPTALSLYEAIEDGISRRLVARNSRTAIGTKDEPSSLFQARIALVVTRLIARTPLLILDEPGFGLTRDGAQAFVAEVAGQCALHATGLLILSHTPEWFRDVTRSEMLHERVDAVESDRHCARITLTRR